MTLTPGERLSFYEILGPLGAGGMGEVYRASDSRLEREVAIKVLPEHLADDEERLRRFEREAKTLATLNHPNVAGIYGVDQQDSVRYLVLELVPGEDLATHLKRGPMFVKDALDACRQIADGLEAAHEAGVVHRDLKPANVCVTPDGSVKILDFGLAKPMVQASEGSAVVDSFAMMMSDEQEAPPKTASGEVLPILMTDDGTVLGTPPYMSPEQARGKPVDRRTDIWAFGCVLYECLTGKRAFSGTTVAEVCAQILEREPDWSALPSSLPPRIHELLRRCLHKEPRSRLRDIGEARVLLESPETAEPPQATTASARRLVVGLVLALLAGFAIRHLMPSSGSPESEPPASVERISIHIPAAHAITESIAMSRDGRQLAWIGGPDQEVHVRTIDSFEIRVLPGTKVSQAPFFSPDGTRVGFWSGGALRSVGVSGGMPRKIVDAPHILFRGASWGDDGRIVLSQTINSGLSRVNGTGGELETLTTIDPASDVRTHRYPFVLPGSKVVLYTRDDNRTSEYFDDASIIARSLVDGTERVIIEGAGRAEFAAGHVVFVRGGDLFARRFDPQTLEVSGEARRIASAVESNTTRGSSSFAISNAGSLAYAPGSDRTQSKRLAWRRPGEAPVVFDMPPAPMSGPHISPDGQRISYTVAGADGRDIWIYDFERKTRRQVSRHGDAGTAVWSIDGQRIFFGTGLTGKPGILAIDVAGGSAQEIYTAPGNGFVRPQCITPEGSTLIATVDETDGRFPLIRVDLSTGKATALLAAQSSAPYADLDPSGAWIAFQSGKRTGRTEIYLTNFESGLPILPVSTEGGRSPRWSADGKTIYYLHATRYELWAVDVDLKAAPSLGTPRRVLDDFYWDLSTPLFDAGRGGRILCTIVEGAEDMGREIRIDSAWPYEGPKD